MKIPDNGMGHGEGYGNGASHNGSGNGHENRALARRPQPYGALRRTAYGPEFNQLPMAILDQQDRRRFNLADYIGLLWRGKWIIVACVMVAGMVAAYYTYSQPYIYRSSLQVIINERDGNVAPLFAGSERFVWQPPERILKKELQILTSQPILLQTASQLVAQRFLDTAERDSMIPVVAASEWKLRARKGRVPAEQFHSLLVSSVASSIKGLTSFKPSKDADIIQIVTTAGDPREAALITNIYAQIYEKDNQQQNRSKAHAVKDFLFKQVQTIRDSLAKQEIELKNYREGNGIVGMSEQTKDLLSSNSQLDNEASATQIEITALSRKIQGMKKQLRERDSNLPQAISSAFPQYITQMQQQIADLEVQRQVIVSSNPVRASEVWYQSKLKALDDQITTLRGKLSAAVAEYKNSSIGSTSGGDAGSSTAALGELRKQIFDDEIQLQTLQAKLAAINSNRGEVRGKITQVPTQELSMERLERDKTALEKIYMQLNEQYNQKVLEEQSVFSNVRILELAQPDPMPISPDRGADILTGSIAGLGIGIGIVLLVAFLDTTIHTPEELEKNGYVMLAAIPAIREEMLEGTYRADITPSGKVSPHLITQVDPKSPVAEAYRSLRTGVQFASMEDEQRTILVTSSTPQEGKSTTSVNTAIVFAQNGSKTLLLDCDLRRPILHSVFGLPKEPGLVNCLVGTVPLDEAIYTTMIPNLDILTSGSIPPNPSELLGSRRMRDLLEELRGRYDTIVIDSPPTAAVTDAVILSTLADITIIVVRAHKTKLEFLQKTRDSLERVFVSPLGIVLNDFDVTQSYGSAYKYYRYYKYYGYDGGEANGAPAAGAAPAGKRVGRKERGIRKLINR